MVVPSMVTDAPEGSVVTGTVSVGPFIMVAQAVKRAFMAIKSARFTFSPIKSSKNPPYRFAKF